MPLNRLSLLFVQFLYIIRMDIGKAVERLNGLRRGGLSPGMDFNKVTYCLLPLAQLQGTFAEHKNGLYVRREPRCH
ncbi:hypothetical protein D3C77_569040 [compost metagenome]